MDPWPRPRPWPTPSLPRARPRRPRGGTPPARQSRARRAWARSSEGSGASSAPPPTLSRASPSTTARGPSSRRQAPRSNMFDPRPRLTALLSEAPIGARTAEPPGAAPNAVRARAVVAVAASPRRRAPPTFSPRDPALKSCFPAKHRKTLTRDRSEHPSRRGNASAATLRLKITRDRAPPKEDDAHRKSVLRGQRFLFRRTRWRSTKGGRGIQQVVDHKTT